MIKIIYNALCIRKYNLYFLKLINLFLNNYRVIESYKQTNTYTYTHSQSHSMDKLCNFQDMFHSVFPNKEQYMCLAWARP